MWQTHARAAPEMASGMRPLCAPSAGTCSAPSPVGRPDLAVQISGLDGQLSKACVLRCLLNCLLLQACTSWASFTGTSSLQTSPSRLVTLQCTKVRLCCILIRDVGCCCPYLVPWRTSGCPGSVFQRSKTMMYTATISLIDTQGPGMSSTLGWRGGMWTRRAWSYLHGRTLHSVGAPHMRP